MTFEIEDKPGAKIGLADYLSRHLVGEALRVKVYDNTFTVAKIRSNNNSLGYEKLEKTTGVAKFKSRISNVSANKNEISKSGRKSPPDEGGKSCDQA